MHKARLGQLDEAAIADYDEAIRLKPDYARAIQQRSYAKRMLRTIRVCNC